MNPKPNTFTIFFRMEKTPPHLKNASQLSLRVVPSNTIKEIKTQLAKKLKIYAGDQIMRFGGKVLDDPLPLSYYNIQQNSTIDVVCHGFHLIIHYFHSTPLDIRVYPYCTIRHIKQCITKSQDVPHERQRLLFKGTEMNLDTNTLYDYNVKWGGHVQLLLRDDPFKIKLYIPSGMTSELTVKAEDTIKDVKQMIAHAYGVRMEQQRLMFNGKKLKNSHALSHYNINNIPRDGLLRLVVTQPVGPRTMSALPFNVHVRNPQHNVTLEVTQMDSIKQIKERIAEQIKTFPEQQVLEFNTKPLANGDTLFDCCITNKDVLTLSCTKYKIIIILPRREFCVVVRAFNTVRYVKCAIITCKAIQYDFKLQFEEKDLDDDVTLFDHGIKAQSRLVLKVINDPIIIYLRREGGTTDTLRVRPTVTIRSLKKKMPIEHGNYMWLFKNQVLSNDLFTLYNCGIGNNSVIDIIPYDLLYETLETHQTHVSTELGDDCPIQNQDDIEIIVEDAPSTPTPSVDVDVHGIWLSQLAEHLNAFDDISDKYGTEQGLELSEQIESARTLFNSISARLSGKSTEMIVSEPMIELGSESGSEFEMFMDSIPYVADLDVKEKDASSKLRADAAEFIYAPNIVVNIQSQQQQQQTFHTMQQQQQQQQQQQTYGMWFMDCVYRIDCCAAFGDSVVSFFMKYNEPSRRRVEVKNEMIEMIQSRVNSVKRKEQQNQNWMVFVFGSESWNIRSIYSDIDIGIQLPFRSKREEKRMFLKQLMCAISKEEVKALQCVSLIHAQYPIIRIRSADKMQFDVSIADEYCIQNKKIINELFDEFERIHVPVRPLVVFVKYWAKQRGILNAFGRYLNSFGYTILTLNYLQFVINNGLLQQGQSYRDYLCYLIYGLFFFYSKCFDVTKHSIQIMRNVCGYQDYVFYDKMNTDSLLQIIDPANGRNNIARKVGYVEYRRIHEEFCRSYQLCNAFSRDHVLKSSLFEQLTQFFK